MSQKIKNIEELFQIKTFLKNKVKAMSDFNQRKYMEIHIHIASS